MKYNKLIDELQATLKVVRLPGPRDPAVDLYVSEMREAVVENLTCLTSGERYDARRTWAWDRESQVFRITLEFAFAVEVGSGSTAHCTVTRHFTLDPFKPDLRALIGALDDEIRRFKVGLNRARTHQLKHVLATEGEAAYTAAIERT